MFCTALILSCLLAPGATLTTDQLAKTWTFVKDVATFTKDSAHDALPKEAQEGVAKAQKEAEKLYAQHAKVHVDMVKGHVDQHTTTVLDVVKKSTASAIDTANKFVDTVVEGFEKKHPTSKGVIPKDVGDRLVFLLYLYIFLSVGWKIFRFGLSIFCFFFCCGMCSKRKSEKKAPSSGGKAASKPKPKMKK